MRTHEVHHRSLCLVLEISILLSFLHSKLSNKVIFPQSGLLYCLVITKTTYYFVKLIQLFAIVNLEVILLKNESSDTFTSLTQQTKIKYYPSWILRKKFKPCIVIQLQSSVVLLSNQHTLINLPDFKTPQTLPPALATVRISPVLLNVVFVSTIGMILTAKYFLVNITI